ncbi:ABC transporter permease [Listeria monocytogenes]|nr:ABC transporter permease [Listeria monocytogenes]
MLFKVALTNMRKNFNQYIVYFVSLIVCVLVFLRLFRYHITR